MWLRPVVHPRLLLTIFLGNGMIEAFVLGLLSTAATGRTNGWAMFWMSVALAVSCAGSLRIIWWPGSTDAPHS